MKEERILPSLSEFIDKQSNTLDYELFSESVYQYNNFLKQPLKLEMFIPCNDKGEPIEKPYLYEKWLKEGHYPSEFNDTCKEYQQALEKTIFEGFEILEGYANCHVVDNGKVTVVFYDEEENEDDEFKSISDLANKVSVREWKWEELKLGDKWDSLNDKETSKNIREWKVKN